MTTTDDRIASLIDRLVADVRPVRRLWPPAMRLMAWLGVVAAVAVALLIVGVRRDVSLRLTTPGFGAELLFVGTAAILAARIALRGAVPGLDDDGLGRLTLVATLIGGGLFGVVQTGASFATSFASFVERGIPCAVTSLILAALPWMTVLWAVSRGLPLKPAQSLAAAGLAAALAAYVLMRLRCGVDESLHVIIWHGGPLVIATCVAAGAGLVLRRARRGAALPR